MGNATNKRERNTFRNESLSLLREINIGHWQGRNKYPYLHISNYQYIFNWYDKIKMMMKWAIEILKPLDPHPHPLYHPHQNYTLKKVISILIKYEETCDNIFLWKVTWDYFYLWGSIIVLLNEISFLK